MYKCRIVEKYTCDCCGMCEESSMYAAIQDEKVQDIGYILEQKRLEQINYVNDIFGLSLNLSY